MKNYRAYIRPFLNENGTPIKPFTNYDLSSPRQLHLILGEIGLSRDKIVEKFTGNIPMTLLEFERLLHGSGYDDWVELRDAGQKTEQVIPETVKGSGDSVRVTLSDNESLSKGTIPYSELYNLPDYKKKYKKRKSKDDTADEEKDIKDMEMNEVLDKLSRWNDYDVDDKGNFSKKQKMGPLEEELRDIGRVMSGSPSWFKNKNIEDCEATVYWYLDMYSLEDQFEANDIYLTADFVTDFSEFKIPFNVIKENTNEANFYQEIFKLLKEDVPSRKIKEIVSRPHENLTISHNQINNMKELTAVPWKR
jgi:hypothetical protein